MRLIAVTLRNYRVHREQTVTFDRERTLIGGPNEAGKSTLVEAIHRALFLKAKGNTEHHRAMRSYAGGQPEVEVAFEVRGETYTIRKRFGSNGSATLLCSSENALAGEEAEQKLAELLCVEAVSGKAVLNQWAHLWVWQGRACEDPSAHATSVKGDLIRRLQDVGAAAVLQSDRDTRTCRLIEEKYQEIFTSHGKPRAGSDLDAAIRADADARSRADAAAARLERLESAASDLERARNEFPAIDLTLAALEQERQSIDERIARLTVLQRQLLDESYQLQGAAARHEAVTSANERIGRLETAIGKGEAALAPLEKEVGTLAEANSSARHAARDAQEACERARAASRESRLALDLARAWHRLFVLQKEKDQLESRQGRVNELRNQASELHTQRAKLPDLSAAAVRKLQKAAIECEKAQFAVESVATGIEVIAADQTVEIAGKAVPQDERHVITEETELRVGGVLLRILPGGGTTLAEARRNLAGRERAFRDELEFCGSSSVSSAVESLALREQLTAGLDRIEAQIDALRPDEIRDGITAITEELAAADAAIRRLAPQFPMAANLGDETAARLSEATAAANVEKCESAETALKSAHDATNRNLEQAEASLTQVKTKFYAQNRALEEQRAEVRVLVQVHGQEEARLELIMRTEQDLKLAQSRKAAVERSIEELQPKLLEADAKRVKRGMEQTRERRTALTSSIAAAEVTLRSDGLSDPHADRSAAELQLRATSARLEQTQRQADAIALLRRTFQEEQQALSEQFTRPLADKISAYLQCVFGPSARVTLELNSDGFSGLAITRGNPAERFRFDSLSGGTQEQTAAAVRLAMAEVLAGKYDGSLPIVFDDAFVYSDPDRVLHLQRMLDHAAEAGLQVIVLTCSPNDYTSLGAHHVTLRAQRTELPVDRKTTGAGDADADAAASNERGSQPDNAPSATEAEQARFLDVLREAGGRSGNLALRDSLHLDEACYERIKECLLASGRVVAGRGRDGSVSVAELAHGES